MFSGLNTRSQLPATSVPPNAAVTLSTLKPMPVVPHR